MYKASMLVELIESMSEEERAYFREQFSAYQENIEKDDLNLFDNICKYIQQSENPEREPNVRLQFSKKLYDNLLLSLRIFNSDQNNQLLFEGLLQESILLFNKGLDRQALKRIRKAENLAEMNNDYLNVIRAQKITTRLLKLDYSHHNYKELEHIYEEKQTRLLALILENKLLSFLDKSFFYRNNIGPKDTEQYKNMMEDAFNFLKYFNHSSLVECVFSSTIGSEKLYSSRFRLIQFDQSQPKKGSQEITPNAQLAYESLSSIYHDLASPPDQKESHKHQLNIIKLFENIFPHLVDEYFRSYMAAVNNYINHCIKNEDFDKAEERIKAFSSISSKDESMQNQINLRSKIFDQIISLNKHDFVAVIGKRKELDQFFRKHFKNVNNLSILTIKRNLIAAYVLGATLNNPRLSERNNWLSEAEGLCKSVYNTFSFKEYDAEIAKIYVLNAIVMLEKKELSAAERLLKIAHSQLRRDNSEERKIVIIIKKCCYKVLSEIWVPLKEFENKTYNIDKWMGELDLWIKSKI